MNLSSDEHAAMDIHPYNSTAIPLDTRILIVGTAPPRRFFYPNGWDQEKDTPFYYGSRDNQLWKDILNPIAQDMGFENILLGSSDERVTKMKRFLMCGKIWMRDVLDTCPRTGISDQDRHIDFQTAQFSDFDIILKSSQVEKIVFTGKEPARWFFSKGLTRDEKQRQLYREEFSTLDRKRQKISDLNVCQKFTEPLSWPTLVHNRLIKFYIAPSPSRSYRKIDKIKKRGAYREILFPV